MKAEKTKQHSDPQSRSSRVRLAAMVTRLFDHWGLESSEQLAMLGLSEGSRMTLQRYRTGKALGRNRDLMDRVGYLLGIHKSLRLLYPHNRELAYRWMKSPNKRLHNATPVDFVRDKGFEGLVSVNRLLDVERGR